MKVELIALSGENQEIVKQIAAALEGVGLALHQFYEVERAAEKIACQMNDIWDSADIIITLGGLDPRESDIIKRLFCHGLGLMAEENQAALQMINDEAKRSGIEVDEFLVRAAYLPVGGTALDPLGGFIPGCAIFKERQCIIMLPPHPTEAMLQGSFAGYAADFAKRAGFLPASHIGEDKTMAAAAHILTSPVSDKPTSQKKFHPYNPAIIRRIIAATLTVCTGLMIFTAWLVYDRMSQSPASPVSGTAVSSESSSQPDVSSASGAVSSSEVSSSSSSEPSSSVASSSSSKASSSSSKASSSSSKASSSSSQVSSSSSQVSSSSSQVSSSSSQVSSSTSQASSSSSQVSSSTSQVTSSSSEVSSSSEPGSSSEPQSNNGDAANETLYYSVGGTGYSMDAYSLICQIVQNEMGTNLHIEAIKAQAVACYSFIKYNNEAGSAPAVTLKTTVSDKVSQAVSAVIGVAAYYNGSYINAVYHSTSCGATTTAQSVWGKAIPYLVSVDSPDDVNSPYYNGSYTISEENLRSRVLSTYGISLGGDPEDWISIDENALNPGGYVGKVTIGGHDYSQGGTVGTAAITGRNIREKLLGFAIRSSCFEVSYQNGNFTFTSRGYGHGVGMSQYGAHFMAQSGYSYKDILTHYFTGVEVH